MHRWMLMWGVAVGLCGADSFAQQMQIPPLQVCNRTKVSGEGTVRITSRSDASHSGAFTFKVRLQCEQGLPEGAFDIIRLSMSDTDPVVTQVTVTAVEQLTSGGKHTPTAYFAGHCTVGGHTGFRVWVTIADNRRRGAAGTEDVVGFLVLNSAGNRVAYGTGPVVQGDVEVQAN
jgi:hypothetical protein